MVGTRRPTRATETNAGQNSHASIKKAHSHQPWDPWTNSEQGRASSCSTWSVFSSSDRLNFRGDCLRVCILEEARTGNVSSIIRIGIHHELRMVDRLHQHRRRTRSARFASSLATSNFVRHAVTVLRFDSSVPACWKPIKPSDRTQGRSPAAQAARVGLQDHLRKAQADGAIEHRS